MGTNTSCCTSWWRLNKNAENTSLNLSGRLLEPDGSLDWMYISSDSRIVASLLSGQRKHWLTARTGERIINKESLSDRGFELFTICLLLLRVHRAVSRCWLCHGLMHARTHACTHTHITTKQSLYVMGLEDFDGLKRPHRPQRGVKRLLYLQRLFAPFLFLLCNQTVHHAVRLWGKVPEWVLRGQQWWWTICRQ